VGAGKDDIFACKGSEHIAERQRSMRRKGIRKRATIVLEFLHRSMRNLRRRGLLGLRDQRTRIKKKRKREKRRASRYGMRGRSSSGVVQDGFLDFGSWIPSLFFSASGARRFLLLHLLERKERPGSEREGKVQKGRRRWRRAMWVSRGKRERAGAGQI